MLTYERQRKNRTTLIELKSASTFQEKDRHLQKLGGSIKASIDKLKRLRTDIQSETNIKKISQLMAQYQKENNYYNELQVSLAEIDQPSDLCKKIKDMNKEFIQTYDPADLNKKLDHMKIERVEHLKTEDNIEMNALNEESLTGQLLATDKYAIRKRILMQEKEELQEIERLINQVKDIATKTSIMINSQGQKIELSVQKMKKANAHLKKGNQYLMQTNEYQQDTNKKYLCFCFLTVVVVSIVLMIVYSTNKNS